MANAAEAGAPASRLAGQAQTALASVPAPQLVIISTIDGDIRCDGTDDRHVPEFGAALTAALEVITEASPESRILILSQAGRPAAEAAALADEPEIRRAFGGTGMCDFFDPNGDLVPERLATLTGIIEQYEAEQLRVCSMFPQCSTDNGVMTTYVREPDHVAEGDWNHLGVRGQAAIAELIWPTVAEMLELTGSGSGPWILYQFYDVARGAPNLGLIRPDGIDNHRLPGGPDNRWHPDWSPDGTQIAYDWNLPSGVAEIAIVGLDSSGERSLLECVAPCYGNGGPAWSPDGRAIGFDGAEGPTTEHAGDLCYLAILDLDSGEVTRFLEHEDCSFADSYLRFSPDGERVVFQREGPAGLAIFTASIDGQDERQLTEWGLGVRPDWSPDGEWIVFMSVEPESHPGQSISLHRVRPDGTDLEQLTSPTGTTIDLYPRWLPDGSGIIFSRCPASEAANCETRTIGPDGSDDRLLLAPFVQHAVHVMWQPSGEP